MFHEKTQENRPPVLERGTNLTPTAPKAKTKTKAKAKAKAAPKAETKAIVVGGGLAGSEAAWNLANQGISVELWEMRPGKMTPAHGTGGLAELVCSNSLKTEALDSASGVLKGEMALLNSLVITCARESRVPAGGALAVDREEFSRLITHSLDQHPLISVIRKEAEAIPSGNAIMATGPLSSPGITEAISRLTGEGHLYFYDAVAPTVLKESIDLQKTFAASRYGKGEGDYLNCPLTQEEYRQFYEALITAERQPLKEFEKEAVFEGCMPVEVMAQRGEQTLLFGPLKPVGLIDPETGRKPYAVVQLRQDNREGTLYNLVGFQTNLRWPEQKRVFSLIPALRNAEFVRYGVMHRNTFINSPKLLSPDLCLTSQPGLFFAGQLTGVEGYVESAATGIVAGVNLGRYLMGLDTLTFPKETMMGGLCAYISTPNVNFQPMNANFGIIPSPEERIRNKKQRNQFLAQRALDIMEAFVATHSIVPKSGL